MPIVCKQSVYKWPLSWKLNFKTFSKIWQFFSHSCVLFEPLLRCIRKPQPKNRNKRNLQYIVSIQNKKLAYKWPSSQKISLKNYFLAKYDCFLATYASTLYLFRMGICIRMPRLKRRKISDLQQIERI